MATRKKALQPPKKKVSSTFKHEWLNEIVRTDTSDGPGRAVKLSDIFMYDQASGVICKICMEAKVKGDFATGKTWTEWKLDYLKRHLRQKVHSDAVSMLYSRKHAPSISQLLHESDEAREERLKKTRSNPEQIKTLIDNVLLAIKINASMLSVQDIHNHMAKYLDLPDSWRSKNYAFEFVESINAVVQSEIMNSVREARFHTLIADESTDITVHKMLVLYIKFREKDEVHHKTVFAGIIQLSGCSAQDIVDAIVKFYADHGLDLNKMVMLTSDGASVMLGKHKGVTALLKRQIPHLTEQHCVAHREDLGIDDASDDVPLMKEVETLLRTVYSMFSRSSVKKAKFTELADVLEVDSLSFRPLNEVRWLSRYQAVCALLRNYSVLTEYCTKHAVNDPIAKYCLRKLTDSKYRIALTVLGDVLEELAQLCVSLQRSNLTVMDGHCLARARIQKLRSQYLGERVHWSRQVSELLESEKTVNTVDIIMFVRKVCEHLDARFPENELREWAAFDLDTLDATSDFDHGVNDVIKLTEKFQALLGETEDVTTQICQQYNDFKFIIKEKRKTGALQTFAETAAWLMKSDGFPDLTHLIDICGTFQASSADCERGFSLMNRIKTKSRNRLEVNHLGQLMRIKSRQAEGPINLNKVYNHWKLDKDRREKI